MTQKSAIFKARDYSHTHSARKRQCLIPIHEQRGQKSHWFPYTQSARKRHTDGAVGDACDLETLEDARHPLLLHICPAVLSSIYNIESETWTRSKSRGALESLLVRPQKFLPPATKPYSHRDGVRIMSWRTHR